MPKDTATAPERVRDKWNDSLRKQAETYRRRFSWHSPVVQKFIQTEYLGGLSVSNYLETYLEGRQIRNALDIGGGLGNQAIAFHQRLNVARFDVVDISDVACQKGAERARAEGLNVHFTVSDLNKDNLPDREYDLIVASGALHHIENLEHLFEQINASLALDGVFFANDYMGPNHMQWGPRQLELMNAIVACLPDELNQVAHRNNEVIRDVKPIPLEIFARVDPSEGVRAADIFRVMEQHLDVERTVPFGQTLAYETLRGRIQNFEDSNHKDNAILTLICLLERELIDAGILESDFNLVIARPKR